MLKKRSGASAYAAALVATGLSIVLLALVPSITARAAAPVLLLAVLVSARMFGTGPGVLASASATLGYGSYFLGGAGFGTKEYWVALATFTTSAIVVGELAARAERRQAEAEIGRQEIERLYQQLETAFERASDAEAARRNEQLKAALLDALRHNLGTPLTSIKAAVTSLLGEGYDEEGAALSGESRVELLHIIDEEADRLERFARGLSTADKVPDEPALSSQAVPVATIIETVLNRATLLTRGFRVTVQIDEAIPPLAVDEGAIAEVLYMLVDNATKYAPEGSEITLRASREGQSHAYVEVIDEGPGVPPRLREHVFEKFFRIEGQEPRDPRRKGIGLGLSIARRLVETQAGRIWVETPLNRRGTAVIMMLPLHVDRQPRGNSTPASVAS